MMCLRLKHSMAKPGMEPHCPSQHAPNGLQQRMRVMAIGTVHDLMTAAILLKDRWCRFRKSDCTCYACCGQDMVVNAAWNQTNPCRQKKDVTSRALHCQHLFKELFQLPKESGESIQGQFCCPTEKRRSQTASDVVLETHVPAQKLHPGPIQNPAWRPRNWHQLEPCADYAI